MMIHRRLHALSFFVTLAVLAWRPADGSSKRLVSSIACTLVGIACESPDLNYGVLLDAGSSSTKLKVYSYSPTKTVAPASYSSALPEISLIADQRFEPGLSNVDNVQSYLENIVGAGKKYVPAEKQTVTPIFLKATAGLRFLTGEESTALIRNVIRALSQDFNPFVFKPSNIGILSGEEEGVYAWVAANYLLGFFNKSRPDNESVGVLEMGGGSTQITFIPNSPLYEGEFQVFVGGRKFEVYVHSYLQFGVDAINLWVAHVLADRSRGSTVLDNPCMLRDDTRNSTVDDGRQIKLRGSSNPDACIDVLNTILTPETGLKCEPKPCAVGNVYQPKVDDLQFYATQGFVHAPKAFNVVGDDEILHLDKLVEAARGLCRKSLKEAVDAGFPAKFASSNCLMGLYIPTLFTLSYGFDPATDNIKVTSEINKQTIDWALGAMVIELTGNNVRKRRSVPADVNEAIPGLLRKRAVLDVAK